MTYRLSDGGNKVWIKGNSDEDWKEVPIKTLVKTYEEKEYGEWKLYDEDFNGWYCTNCDNPWHLDDGTPQENNMHFCPFCGADMRGKEYDSD